MIILKQEKIKCCYYFWFAQKILNNFLFLLLLVKYNYLKTKKFINRCFFVDQNFLNNSLFYKKIYIFIRRLIFLFIRINVFNMAPM